MINSQVHIFKILSSYSKFLFFQVKYVFSSCKRFTHHCQRAQRRTRKGPSTQKNLSKITFLMKYYKLSCSAHQTPNFMNPEFQFPQFKVSQNVFFFLFNIMSHIGIFGCILILILVFCYHNCSNVL